MSTETQKFFYNLKQVGDNANKHKLEKELYIREAINLLNKDDFRGAIVVIERAKTQKKLQTSFDNLYNSMI